MNLFECRECKHNILDEICRAINKETGWRASYRDTETVGGYHKDGDNIIRIHEVSTTDQNGEYIIKFSKREMIRIINLSTSIKGIAESIISISKRRANTKEYLKRMREVETK